MPNWMKKVVKGGSDALAPGEMFLAAQQFNQSSIVGQGAGTGAAVAAGGLVGGIAGAVVEKRRDKKEQARQEEVAESSGIPEAQVAWPGSSAIVAVTDRRIVFFGMKGMAGAGDVFMEIPREELVRVDRLELDGSMTAGRVKSLQVRFVRKDGTAVSVHAPYLGVNRKRVDEFLSVADSAT